MKLKFATPFLIALLFASVSCGCRKIGEANSTATTASSPYSTTFPLVENPISENGSWIGGSSAGASLRAGGKIWSGGRLWGDVQTISGLAYGVSEPTEFGDPTELGVDRRLTSNIKLSLYYSGLLSSGASDNGVKAKLEATF